MTQCLLPLRRCPVDFLKHRIRNCNRPKFRQMFEESLGDSAVLWTSYLTSCRASHTKIPTPPPRFLHQNCAKIL